MNGFNIASSQAGGRGGAIFVDYEDNLRLKITEFTIDNGIITNTAAGSGLADRTADGIYLHDTGEDRDTIQDARDFSRVDFERRYLGPVRLRNMDIIKGVKMTGRGGSGSGITADHVCNKEELDPSICDMNNPEVVLHVEACDIQGFGTGIDAFESSRLKVTTCNISGNTIGVRLDHCIADIMDNKMLNDQIGLDVVGLDDLKGENTLTIEGNDFMGGDDGIRFDTNVIRLGHNLLSPNIKVHFNNLTKHSVYGIEVKKPQPAFTINAEQNWWGSFTGPNPPFTPMPNPQADNVSDGVNYARFLSESHGK